MSGALRWVGFTTIVRKEVTRILRIWSQTIVPPAITMTLYFIIFGELIGQRIGDMGGFSCDCSGTGRAYERPRSR